VAQGQEIAWHKSRKSDTLGMSVKLRVLIVIHTYRGEEEIRIISARKATKKEQNAYEKRIQL
jgi:uncharacterized DUF497 family protein